MIKVKFNKFERVAGIFLAVSIVGAIFLAIGVAIKQGWFEAKVMFTTEFENAEGVHPGTLVQISGLRAGSVEEVELQNDNKIKVTFYILSKFQHRIKQDSYAQLVRPFIIGERALDVVVGSNDSPKLAAGALMTSHEAVDMMSLLNGKKLGPYLETMSGMMDNVRTLAQAFLNKDRTRSFVDIFDKIDPLLRNLNTLSFEVIKLSKQATKDQNLEKVLGNLNYTTRELNAMLPTIKERAPEYAADISILLKNINVLTQEFKVIIPALAEVGPELPKASRRAVEALDEAVVLLKAMEKSMFLSGSVNDVKEDEARRDAKREAAKKARKPASEEDKESVPTAPLVKEPVKETSKEPVKPSGVVFPEVKSPMDPPAAD